jgi:hypothetical protein
LAEIEVTKLKVDLEDAKILTLRHAAHIIGLEAETKRESDALRDGIERLEFLSHLSQGIPTTPNDRLCLIGEEASALLAEKETP